FRQEPNGAYTGSTWVYDVTVRPQPKIAPAPALAKRAENLTHPNGPTQPGDRIRYTIEASNGAAGSLWTDVVVTDPLPACLELDEGSVRLDNPSAAIAGKPLSKAPSVAASDVGKFSLSAPGAGGRSVLSVPAGDIGGGANATVTFECTVRGELDFADPAAVDLGNVASSTGTRPDPENPDGPGTGPVAPPDTDPATPPGGSTVAPADPDVRVSKSVENLTAPGAKVTHLGDRLRYTIELSNAGAADSCLMAAAVSDPLPAGIEPVAGTIRLALDGGEPIEVPDAAYDRASRTIAVTVGDLWGGHAAVLTFECTVGEAALEQNTANIAHAHGEVPSESPGSRPEDPDPGKPAEPPAGEPEASSPPASPAPVVPGDPAEDDVAIAKTAENLTRDDGATHVGDTVRYRIALSNSGPGTGWMDAVIRDDVPEGLEPVSGSIRLTLPDGSEVAVDDAAYDPATRILAVAVGHLYGRQEAALVFDALVTGAAVGADIGNVAVGLGTPPSAWDPDGERPGPGAPFDPPGGWDDYERTHPRVESDPTYPPGADASGGVLPGDEGGKRRTTIAHRLAQTGDALAAAALLPAALALAAGAALLASRRRQRASR
ncbi:isopeptide-forming domain-containing fimbrial protein, partial [Enterorhabdus sp. NM05_H27]